MIGNAEENPAAPPTAVDSERLVIRPASTSSWSLSLWRFLFGPAKPPPGQTSFNVFFLSDAGESFSRREILRGFRTVWAVGGLWLLSSLVLVGFALAPVSIPPDSWRARYWVDKSPEAQMGGDRLFRFQRYVKTLGPKSFGAIPALIEAMSYKDPRYRDAAARALIRMLPAARDQARDAIPALVEMLHPRNRRDHIQTAIITLGAFGPLAEPAVPDLVRLLLRRDPDPVIRYQAAIALGDIGPAARDAIPALGEALEDRSRGVRDAARAALRRIDR